MVVEEDGGTGAAAWIVLCRRAVAGWMGGRGYGAGAPAHRRAGTVWRVGTGQLGFFFCPLDASAERGPDF